MIKYKKKKKDLPGADRSEYKIGVKLLFHDIFITYFHSHGKKIYMLEVRILGQKYSLNYSTGQFTYFSYFFFKIQIIIFLASNMY